VRHENSVLFSLGNLARFAAPPPVTASPGRGEGSGLLDIQALARSLAPVRDERSSGGVGALPVDGALPFSEPAVLIPSVPPSRDRRLIWALAATAGALAVVAAVLLVIVMRDGPAAYAGTSPALAASPAPGAAGAPVVPGSVARGEPNARSARASADPTEHAATSASVGHTEHATDTPSADRTEHAAAAPSADPAARAATAPSADPTERTATAPSADPTERTATAPSAHRTERATASVQTGRSATSAHAAGSATPSTDPRGTPADAAARRSFAHTGALVSPPGTAEACSEVTCIVNGYADPCCAAFRRPAAGGAPLAARAELPEHLDRAAIADGLGRIDTSGCGKQSSAHGDVSVSVRVSPAGTVTGVTVRSSPDPALDACVTAAVNRSAFAATQRGGSFGYAWRF
jgi:TonB family protein